MQKRWVKRLAVSVSVLVGLVLLNLLFFNATPKPKRVEAPISLDYGVASESFQRDLVAHMGMPIVAGNRVEWLANGDEIWPAQLDAIAAARHHVHIETFQFKAGELSERFIEVLKERLDAGVEVRFILDFMGSVEAEFSGLADLEEAGAEVIRWRAPSPLQLSRLNHRTHRKLLVVDGEVGFIGGANMTDDWLGPVQEGGYRDNHFRVTGPVVNQLQAAFMDNWIAASGEALFGPAYFPVLEQVGDMVAQVVISTPREGKHRVRKFKLMAIAGAREHIRLVSAYFYPDQAVFDALLDARERGIEVDVITPGSTIDKNYVRMASRSHWGQLLEAGVRIHEYEKTMLHAKLTIIDRDLVSVGSTNLDNRSFRINDEANLNIFDRAFAERMIEVFEADLEHTVGYDMDRWEQRGSWERLRGWATRVVGPHL